MTREAVSPEAPGSASPDSAVTPALLPASQGAAGTKPPVTAEISAESDWSFEIVAGPNRGAVVPIEGEARIGTALENDIVLADPGVASEQMAFTLEHGAATLHPLTEGVSLAGRAVGAGRVIDLRDGQMIQAGDTVLRIHGPARKRRLGWLLIAAPVLVLLVGAAALVGLGGTGRSGGPPPAQAAATAAPRPSAGAAEALTERLRAAGLGDSIQVTAAPGAVVAEGRLAGPLLALWGEQQVWFDSQYRGTLSLVNRVREAAPDERPNIQLRAVSFGDPAYIITATGDRYPEGSVVDGWMIERITPDKVVLSRNGRRAELVL